MNNKPFTLPHSLADYWKLFQYIFSLFSWAALVLLIVFMSTLPAPEQERLFAEWIRIVAVLGLVAVVRGMPATVRAVKAEWQQKRPVEETT